MNFNELCNATVSPFLSALRSCEAADELPYFGPLTIYVIRLLQVVSVKQHLV